MRELNECTEEVFRRSEKRIRERKRNRTRALALCIPICLIVTVWSVMSLPAMMWAEETGDHAPPAGEMAGDVPGSLDCPYTAVEIQAPERYGTVTDTASVAEMFQAIHSLFADAASNGKNVGENYQTNHENCDLAETTNQWKNYAITFIAEDGSQTVYHLNGNTLVNVSANEAIFLSDTQTAGLMAVLGISE